MESAHVNLNSLGLKAQTKNEIYRFLVTEAEMYLPPQKETSIYFVRDIFHNRKRALYANEIKVRAVPHIEGLRVDDMLWFIEHKCPEGANYLPNDYRKRSINRDWLANLCNTLNETDFKKFIDNAIKQREQLILNQKSLEFQVDPRIVKAVEKSSMLSTSKGRSHLLLRDLEEEKTVKGLTKIKNMQEVKIYEAENEIDKLRNEILLLQSEIEQRDVNEKEDEKHRQLLSELYDKGIIDEDGNYVDDIRHEEE